MITGFRTLLACATLALAVGPSPATEPPPREVATIPLSDLVSGSDVIAVGVVVAASDGEGTLEMLAVWKGPDDLDTQLVFRAEPTWTCDTSTAVRDELGVFFLRRQDGGAPYELVHSGRGRMPFQSALGRAWVSYQDVSMPGSIVFTKSPPAPDAFSHTVPLDGLRREVLALVAPEAAER